MTVSSYSILDFFPPEIIQEIFSHMDLQTIGRFAQVSVYAYSLVLETKRTLTMKKFVKRNRAIMVKRISPNIVLMIHPFIIEGNTNNIGINPYKLGHFELDLDTLTKKLIKKSEYIEKAYPIDYENMRLVRIKNVVF
jgi:hypothetical protein